MNYKSITLKNFQKHSDLTIDFTNNVNIIHGETGKGKSCLRRAFEWVIRNEPIDTVRKEGTKQTSVILTLESGVEIEKVRSTSINRYILRKGKDEQEFNSIGRDVPQEILDVLKTEQLSFDGETIDLNISKQIAFPFLLDKSPSFRMKLFNKLTGNAEIDSLLKLYNKDCLGISKELKIREKDLGEQETNLEVLQKDVVQLRKKEQKTKQHLDELKKLEERYRKIEDLKKKFKNLDITLEMLKVDERKIKTIKIDDNINSLINQNRVLKELIQKKEKIETEIKECEQITVVTVNIDSTLKDKITKHDILQKTILVIQNNEKSERMVTEEIKKCKTTQEETEQEYKEFLKENKICPVCKGEINDECLKGIKL